jgi:phospholipase/lecithinase/hemolysin
MEGNARTACTSIRAWAVAVVAAFSIIGLVPLAQAQRAANFNQAGVQKSSKAQGVLKASEQEAFQQAKELEAVGDSAPAGRGPGYTPKTFYIFGDSLSDTGNAYARYYDVFSSFGFKLYPPFYAVPRWSNGLMWPDFLGKALGVAIRPDVDGGTNYAIAGSTISPENYYTIPGHPEITGFAQVDQFLAAHQRAHPQAVYIVWLGGNDIDPPASFTQWNYEQLSILVGRLYAAGARNFLIPNLVDLGKLPLVISWGDPTYAQQLSDMTVLFNQLLAGLPAQFPNANIRIVDVYRFRTMIDRYPRAFGFTNTTDGCYLSYGDGSICTDPDKHWYWDGSHPSTRAHKLLSNLFALELAKAGWLK